MARPPNPPLTTPPGGSPTPSPNDHLRLLIELLRPATPELGRRWLAALLLVPTHERQRVVEAVEARIVAEFGSHQLRSLQGVDRDQSSTTMTAIGPDVQRDGYVERLETTYEPALPKPAHAANADKDRRGPGRRSKPA